jgi:hypothetical protein
MDIDHNDEGNQDNDQERKGFRVTHTLVARYPGPAWRCFWLMQRRLFFSADVPTSVALA